MPPTCPMRTCARKLISGHTPVGNCVIQPTKPSPTAWVRIMAAAGLLRRAAHTAQPSKIGKHSRSMMAWVRGYTKSRVRRGADSLSVGFERTLRIGEKQGFLVLRASWSEVLRYQGNRPYPSLSVNPISAAHIGCEVRSNDYGFIQPKIRINAEVN